MPAFAGAACRHPTTPQGEEKAARPPKGKGIPWRAPGAPWGSFLGRGRLPPVLGPASPPWAPFRPAPSPCSAPVLPGRRDPSSSPSRAHAEKWKRYHERGEVGIYPPRRNDLSCGRSRGFRVRSLRRWVCSLVASESASLKRRWRTLDYLFPLGGNFSLSFSSLGGLSSPSLSVPTPEPPAKGSHACECARPRARERAALKALRSVSGSDPKNM